MPSVSAIVIGDVIGSKIWNKIGFLNVREFQQRKQRTNSKQERRDSSEKCHNWGPYR